MTGDVLGTLRYMSPEQALAKHGLVAHHTDIYALGATLYELLTLRPVVDGVDREEILRKLAFEEPAMPRSLDRSIPVDLESILLKALAKEPRHRYSTASALAEDLKRFLASQPTRARRAGPLARAGQWCLRPERFRDAGVVMLSVNAMILLWMCLGLLALPLGIIEPEHPYVLVREFLTRIALYFVPTMWIATKIIQRRLWAACTGGGFV